MFLWWNWVLRLIWSDFQLFCFFAFGEACKSVFSFQNLYFQGYFILLQSGSPSRSHKIQVPKANFVFLWLLGDVNIQWRSSCVQCEVLGSQLFLFNLCSRSFYWAVFLHMLCDTKLVTCLLSQSNPYNFFKDFNSSLIPFTFSAFQVNSGQKKFCKSSSLQVITRKVAH